MVMFGGIDCYYCGKLKPLEEMRRIDVWEESGRSGGSYTVRGSAYGYSNVFRSGKGSRKGGGVSYNTGRTYYKKVKAYICDSCLAKQQAAEAQRKRDRLIVWTGLLVAIVGAIIFI